MNVTCNVFDLATGEALRTVQCPKDSVGLQAGPGEISLETVHFTVEGNRPIIGEMLRVFREQKIDGGAPTPFGVADSDLGSRTNIIGTAVGALLMGKLGQAFSTIWKMQDKSLVPMDETQFFTMALSVLLYVNNCHTRARELEAEIIAATNMAELLAIDVTAGWP